MATDRHGRKVFPVHDKDEATLVAIPISPQEIEKLDAGERIVIHFHLPRLFNKGIGQGGFFSLIKKGDKYVADDVEAVKKCAVILRAAGIIDD